jgi:SAM-dependent methyltransferase
VPSELNRATPSTYAPSHDDVLLGLAGAVNYNDWLFGRARPYLGRRVLDVGAGIGTFTALAAEHAAEVTALEPDEVFAARLREQFATHGGVRVIEKDAVDVDPASLEPFDSIVCFNVLEHVDDDRVAARRFHDLLAPGGRLLLLVPAHAWLSSPFDRAVGHERRYEAGPLRDLLVGAGFAIDRLQYVNPVGALGWLVSMRLRRRDTLPGGQVRAFDRLVPLLKPLDRLRLPVGQSLWAVARKPG